jgi:hypothetical protein
MQRSRSLLIANAVMATIGTKVDADCSDDWPARAMPARLPPQFVAASRLCDESRYTQIARAFAVTAAEVTLDPNASAHCLDPALRNRQAETGTAEAPGRRTIGRARQ